MIKYMTLLGACLFSSLISAATLNRVVVFGDSLSDKGNLYEFTHHELPSSKSYCAGRFSDGKVWVEDLMRSYYPSVGEHLLDYAVGGAAIYEGKDELDVFSLRREVNLYLISHTVDERTLYVFWMGANNYLNQTGKDEKVLQAVDQGNMHDMQRLASQGAKYIAVMNLPDLAKTPYAQKAPAEEHRAELMAYYTTRHNALLKERVVALQKEYPQVEWIYFDVNSQFDEVFKHAKDYGFSSTSETCVIDDNKAPMKSVPTMVASIVGTQIPDNCLEVDSCPNLFFDPVHPSAMGHRWLAQKFKAVLDGLGISFG